MHSTKDDWNYITPIDFYNKYYLKQKEKDYYLIDLRSRAEYKKGHTSSQILTLLKLLGYNVISIKYGYGISPIKLVPVAGWLDYGLPITK